MRAAAQAIPQWFECPLCGTAHEGAIGDPCPVRGGNRAAWFCEVCHEVHEADTADAREAVRRRVCLHELHEARAEAAAEGRTPRFTLLYAGDALTRPAPSWDVENVFVERSNVVIFGPPDSWKTFFSVGMGMSVATRRSFHGHRVVTGGPVLSVIGEGAGLYDQRLISWLTAHDCPIDRSIPFAYLPHAVNMLNSDEVDLLIETARPLAPRVVFIDTMHRNMGGGDDSSSRDVGLYIRHVDRMRDCLRTAVATIHHTGWDETRERGSTALRGAADTLIAVRRQDDLLTVSCRKQKDALPFDDLTLKLTPVPGTDSCVLRAAEDVITGTALTDNQRRALQTMQTFNGDGVTMTKWIEATPDVPSSSMYRVAARLEALGYVTKKGQKVVWTGRHEDR